VPYRYCSNCGQELGEEARFCPSCGRPVHEVAHVPTPEADVAVPPLSSSQAGEVGEVSNTEDGARVSGTDGIRNTLMTLGIIALVIWILAALGSGSPGGAAVPVVLLAVLLYWVFYRPVNTGGTNSRQLLVSGAAQPISDAERSRLLGEEVGLYMREGFFVRQRTSTTAQLVKPKQFSFIWAFLWLLVFGIGLVVYLIYYAAKQDEGRYVEVDDYGAVRATRQVRHVL
jgi:hypothetical protein